MITPTQFDNWEDAFDYCRENDCPTIVHVVTDSEDIVVKLFPSGATKTICRLCL